MKNTTSFLFLFITLLVSVITLTAAPVPAADNWENSCASCHGADGKGQTKMGKKLKVLDYTVKASLEKLSDDELAKIILDGAKDPAGKERMKGYKDELTGEEIAELVQFIRAYAK